MKPVLILFLLCFFVVCGHCEAPVTRVAFGSCSQQDKPIPILERVVAFQPQLWIWMGDNIYADTIDRNEMAAKYAQLAANQDYARLVENCTVIGTWDDHDYGKNDAGKEYPMRETSQECFLDFFGVPAEDPRRERAGVYSSHIFGPQGKQVKVILLDTRYHRDSPGPDGDILGPAQWEWLEQKLTNSAAQVHLLVSSIQVIPSDHDWEKWANFPAARKRLFELLDRDDIPPVTILSGDRHLGEISVETSALPYPLYDITSSSLNKPIGKPRKEENSHRVGENFVHSNFGTLEIDWNTMPPMLRFALRDEQGQAVRTLEIQQER
jgi:alkaline phosphatase D